MTFNVLEAQANHQQMVELLYRTHQIFCGIMGKDIALLTDNPPGRTDTETFISIPIEDPEADKIHKHEWQHIFFKSNLRARAAFVDAYVETLKKRFPALEERSMSDFLHVLVNGLDDIRVCSLWEPIYPHSADEVQKRWKRIIIGSGRYQHDLVMYLMGLGLGIEASMDRSEWVRYRSVLKDAVEKVIRRGFPTCLLAARWIVESVLSDITAQHLAPTTHSVLPPKPVQFIPSAAQAPTGARLGSQVKLSGGPPVAGTEEATKQTAALTKLSKGAQATRNSPALQGSWKMMDTDAIPRGPDPDTKGTADMVRAAMGVSSPHQVEYMLNQSQLDVDKMLNELKNRTKTLSPSERLMKGMDGRAIFVKIEPGDVDELVLREEDKRLINVLKHSFTRLMGRKKQVLSTDGTLLDPQAYIDLMNGSADTDIFIEEESAKGFSAILLLDMSGSMKSKWDAVARACKVVAKAMKFPFSKLEVWGFTTAPNGTAVVLQFQDTEKGYLGSDFENIWGLTPLHIAVEVSLRRLRTMPGSTQHLIVLTDGFPTHMSADRTRVAQTSDLFAEVARQISSGRKRGVNVVGLISGDEIDDISADTMFGNRRFWTRVPNNPNELFNALVGVVKKAFVGFLRSK